MIKENRVWERRGRGPSLLFNECPDPWCNNLVKVEDANNRH